ncbi:VOC family protein [Chitinibacter sp. SCUT-21]|uniref:VOC family protein n=1 Tax=Chitinibacter sp. SCUT-21 TaxID=2970891 RepID=UPI0035A6677C
MSLPVLDAFDHVHIYVADRIRAEAWYQQVLGFTRSAELEFWAVDGGPLTLQNASGSVHLALFQKANASAGPTVAFRVGAQAFGDWRAHLQRHEVSVDLQDHQVSLSLYFADPDGNRYEITTYDYASARDLLALN